MVRLCCRFYWLNNVEIMFLTSLGIEIYGVMNDKRTTKNLKHLNQVRSGNCNCWIHWLHTLVGCNSIDSWKTSTTGNHLVTLLPQHRNFSGISRQLHPSAIPGQDGWFDHQAAQDRPLYCLQPDPRPHQRERCWDSQTIRQPSLCFCHQQVPSWIYMTQIPNINGQSLQGIS